MRLPVVEVAHHRHTSGTGGPHGEVHTALGKYLGAEHLPQALVSPLVEQMKVEGTQHEAEA